MADRAGRRERTVRPAGEPQRRVHGDGRSEGCGQDRAGSRRSGRPRGLPGDPGLVALVNGEAMERLTDILVLTVGLDALLRPRPGVDPAVQLSRARDLVERNLTRLLNRELDSRERLHAAARAREAAAASARRAMPGPVVPEGSRATGGGSWTCSSICCSGVSASSS